MSEFLAGPTASELDAIEREWPEIDAELAVTTAEVNYLTHPGTLTRLRLLRAQAALATLRQSPGVGRVAIGEVA